MSGPEYMYYIFFKPKAKCFIIYIRIHIYYIYSTPLKWSRREMLDRKSRALISQINSEVHPLSSSCHSCSAHWVDSHTFPQKWDLQPQLQCRLCTVSQISSKMNGGTRILRLSLAFGWGSQGSPWVLTAAGWCPGLSWAVWGPLLAFHKEGRLTGHWPSWLSLCVGSFRKSPVLSRCRAGTESASAETVTKEQRCRGSGKGCILSARL